MKQTVHILATVRKPELLDAALFVFRSLRTGFPDAAVKVWGNGLNSYDQMLLAHAVDQVKGEFRNLPPTSHDAWIESLIEESIRPFWICDTDVVFWDPVEEWFSLRDVVYAGRREPEFDEEWTQTRHVERLHTCLMYLNPAAVRSAMREFVAKIPPPWRNSADFPFIRQHFVPVHNGATLFYDSCAGLFQAAPGEAFTDGQNEAFDHLHCATYADLASPALSCGLKMADGKRSLQDVHRLIFENKELARGIKQKQDAYYASRKPKKIYALRS